MTEEKKKKKKFIFIILILILFVIGLFLFCFKNQTFYEYGEDLYTRLNESDASYGELDEHYNFSKYSCTSIIYSEGLLEFFNCEIEKDKVEEYCIYDGENFDCNSGDKELDIKFNDNNVLDYNNNDISISLDYNGSASSKLLYCTTTGAICVPDMEYTSDILISENSNSNKVCVKEVYEDFSESETICSQNYIVDKIKPEINDYIIEGTLGLNGYYISDVIFKDIAAIDTISGIKETDINISEINYNTNGETVIIKVTDNAGNILEKEIIIKVDKSKPSIGKIILDGTMGLNGWYTSDLKISSLNGFDDESGHNRTTTNISLIDSSVKSETIILTTYDNADNKTTYSEMVKVDKEGPSIIGMSDIEIKVNGIVDYFAGVSAVDTISGVNGDITIVTNDVDLTKTGEYTITYRAIDNAGNETIASRKVIVDQDTISASFNADVYSDNNWYKENISVLLDIKEDVSNIKYCVTSFDNCEPNIEYSNKIDITNEGNNKVCINAEINGSKSEIICSDLFKIDKVNPTIDNIMINNAVPKEWYNVDTVLTSYDAIDDLSGIKDISVINRELSDETDGENITVKAVDNAGNETVETVLVKIDKTKPTITYTLSGDTFNNIWYYSDVAISNLKATDTLSGAEMVSANKNSFTTETTGENLVITAVDKAGNIATETVSIKIDKTEPTINSYELAGTIVDGWYTTNITLDSVLAVDSISGIDQEFLRQEIENFLIDYETKGTQAEIRVRDNAGHYKTAIFNVKVDLAEPNSGEIILKGDSSGDWYTSEVQIENTAGSDFISGVKESSLNIDIIAADGTDTTVELTTTDNAGHITVLDKNVKVDSTMPILESIEIFGNKLDNGWYVTDVTFGQVKAYDETSGVFESKIDIVAITENTVGTTVTISITDNASNKLTITETIKIDKEIPTITSTGDINIEDGQSVDVLDYFDYEFGISEGNVSCKLDGVEQDVITETLLEGTYTLECTAKSNAGLSSSATTSIIVSDNYEILDYIESNGGQYIDTGVSNTGDYIFEAEFLSTNLAVNSGSWLIGGRVNFDHSLGVHFTTTGVYTGYGGKTIQYRPAISANTWHDLYFTRFGLEVSGKHYNVPSQLIIPAAYEIDIRIGGNTVLSTGAPDIRNFYGYIRSFKITDAITNEVVRDYIPVEMTDSGEVGLFDLVENKFYKSDGTTDYIAHYK